MTIFSDLGLAETVLRALKAEGYDTPTPIQAQAIPPLLEGRDLLGIAQTGTGKTCAFATPLITRLLQFPQAPRPKQTRVLVLAPTRELAAQIGESFKTYGRFAGLRVAAIFGGVGFGAQFQALPRGLDVLVATPAACSTIWPRATCAWKGRRPWCSTRPTTCSTSASSSRSARFSRNCRSPGNPVLLGDHAGGNRDAGQGNAAHPVKVAVAPVAKTADRVAQRVILVEASASATRWSTCCAIPTSAARSCSPAPSAAPTASPSSSTTRA